ncbi:MAG: metallophosphoesterase [Rhodospirillales bacterium]
MRFFNDNGSAGLGRHVFTFAVIADTHMRPEEGDESSPWEVNTHANGRARYVAALLNRLDPDFTIHLGDIVHPVPELPTYGPACEAAKAAFVGLNKNIRYIPGNHDVGDKPNDQMPAGQVEEHFVDAYERYFGAGHSSFDHQGCHFTLINAQIINSGFKREALQWEWLERDLADHNGQRIFLFSHYPPYIREPEEASHYDNIDEPGRSRLLRLIEKHSVEALFCGHVHGFFYNRHGDAESYILPATSFFRQDYAELFRIEPADQFGRNDAEKLGFFLVNVYEHGHAARLVRTNGLELALGEKIATRKPRITTYHAKEMSMAPVGVHLRHPWNETTDLPYNGPMEEFSRKRVRNDYTLLALWELGIRKIRVPLSELLDEKTRDRLAALRRIGHQITVFAFEPPTGKAREALVNHRALVDALEVVIQWRKKADFIAALSRIKQETGLPVYLAKIETSADKKRAGSRFSHFVSYGFRAGEIRDVDDFLELEDARKAADGFIFRVGLDKSPWEDILTIGSLSALRQTKAVVNIRLASENPAEMNDDDRLNANQLAEAIAIAFGCKNLDVFLDTFVDLDRGYFPRRGLFDRRFNPRKTAFVFQHLNSFMAGLEDPVELKERYTNAAGTICIFAVADRECYLLLPQSAGATGLLQNVDPSSLLKKSGRAQWVDLLTGEQIEVSWQKAREGDGIALDPLPALDWPSLLVVE